LFCGIKNNNNKTISMCPPLLVSHCPASNILIIVKLITDEG